MNANERKEQMLRMKMDGATYEEIGKEFNLSKQRIHMIIGKQSKGHFKWMSKERCVYPNLRKWINDNQVSVAEFCRRLYGNSHPENHYRVSRFLKGYSKEIQKGTIDKYLMVTGLTYEKLFEMEGDK